jgi:hypothetical protein
LIPHKPTAADFMSARDYKYFTAEIALPVFYIPGSKNQGFLMSALLNPDRHILTLQTRIEPDYKYGLYNMGNPLLPVQTHAAEQWKERCGPSVVGRVSIPNIPLEPLLKVISSSKKVLLYYPGHI